ncbi:energy-coupling factor transporter transmembrane component T family protein [Thermophilibacter sp.]
MRRDPALGAYLPGSTPAHRLDARVKVLLLVLLAAATFASSTAAGLALALLALVAALLASQTPPTLVLRGLRPAAVVLAVSLLANALTLVGQPGLSVAGLARGAMAVAHVAVTVGLALVLSATTTPPALAEAVAWALGPLRRVGVPVTDVSMTVAVALRFVPLTAEELERIRCAQRSRGARLDEGGVVARLRGWGQLLVPLLVALFRRADELARAMCDRCYTGSQTSLAEPLRVRDWALLACGLAWAAAITLL